MQSHLNSQYRSNNAVNFKLTIGSGSVTSVSGNNFLHYGFIGENFAPKIGSLTPDNYNGCLINTFDVVVPTPDNPDTQEIQINIYISNIGEEGVYYPVVTFNGYTYEFIFALYEHPFLPGCYITNKTISENIFADFVGQTVDIQLELVKK